MLGMVFSGEMVGLIKKKSSSTEPSVSWPQSIQTGGVVDVCSVQTNVVHTDNARNSHKS